MDQNMITSRPNECQSNKFYCFGENTEKYRSFSVSIDKKTDEKTDVMTEFKIKFIDSIRLMLASLSSLNDKLAKKIQEKKAMSVKTNKKK